MDRVGKLKLNLFFKKFRANLFALLPQFCQIRAGESGKAYSLRYIGSMALGLHSQSAFSGNLQLTRSAIFTAHCSMAASSHIQLTTRTRPVARQVV